MNSLGKTINCEKLEPQLHTKTQTNKDEPKHTVLQHRWHPTEPTPIFPSQKISKHVLEGIPSDLRALLHPYLSLGLSGSSFADLGALGSGVGVAAAGEGPSQPFLSRDHLKPVSCSKVKPRAGRKKGVEEGNQKDMMRKKEERLRAQLTWDLQVQVTGAPHCGDGGGLAFPGDTFFHPTLTKYFHRKRTSC